MIEKYLRPSGKWSSFYFNIPPRTRLALLMGTLIGLAIVWTAQQIGSDFLLTDLFAFFNTEILSNFIEFARLDNIISFVGFSILAAVFTLGFNPKLWIPSWISLVIVGYILSYLNFLNNDFNEASTSREVLIMIITSSVFSSKAYGIAFGALIGSMIRAIYIFIRSELADYRERKNTLIFKNTEQIYAQDDLSDCIYVIRQGLVELKKFKKGELEHIKTAHPGEILGDIGAIENTPRSSFAFAVGDVCLYKISRADLVKQVQGQDHPALLVARHLAKEVHRYSSTSKSSETKQKNSTPRSVNLTKF